MTPLPPDWRAQFKSFLSGCISMALATASPSGSPRVADVYFVSDDDLNLYFYSDPASRHTRNIQRDPRVAATMRLESMNWHDIRGVQVEGIAGLMDDPSDRDRAWRLMCDKFPFYESFTDVVLHLGMYRITPHWIRWIDNSVSFGHKEDFDLE